MISEFSLFVFTTLGGIGAGMYAASAVFPAEGKRSNALIPAIPLVLLAIGGIALILHLGHPERMLNVLGNPAAGITMEAFASGAFGLVLVIDLLLVATKGTASKSLRMVGAIVAVVLCLVMGYAYYLYDGVAAWHAIPTYLLFLCGDLAAGMLLLGALCEGVAGKPGFAAAGAVLSVLAALAFAWEGAHFAGIGRDVIPFVLAAIVAIAGAAAVFASNKKSSVALRWLAFVCVFIAVVIARYTFYGVV